MTEENVIDFLTGNFIELALEWDVDEERLRSMRDSSLAGSALKRTSRCYRFRWARKEEIRKGREQSA